MKNEEKIFAVISIIAGLVALITLIWVFIKYPSEQVKGERFVNDEIQVLSIVGTYFNVPHFKPITIMIISTFVCWLCALEALRENLMKLPMLTKRLILVSLFVIAFVFSYEVIWNFLMWTSAHIINPNLPLDSLAHQLNPSMVQPINFDYVTKIYSLILAISLYSIFFFHENMKK